MGSRCSFRAPGRNAAGRHVSFLSGGTQTGPLTSRIVKSYICVVSRQVCGLVDGSNKATNAPPGAGAWRLSPERPAPADWTLADKMWGMCGIYMRRRSVGSVSLGGVALSAASAPPLLAFCLRWPGPCRRVSAQPAACAHRPATRHRAGLCFWSRLPVEPCGFLRFMWGQACPHSSSRPWKGSPIPHLWLTVEALPGHGLPVRTVALPGPMPCPCCQASSLEAGGMEWAWQPCGPRGLCHSVTL